MAKDQHDGHLGAVYGASGPEDVARLYDDWASTYDDEMLAVGYRHPTICLALLARHLPRDCGPLLDAGAGTGVLGEWLKIVGYRDVEALDISAGMLEVARRRKVYSRLHNLALGTQLPFADDSFAGIVSAGVFTSGHVGTEGLGELIRICRPGGVIVLTVKDALWNGGFADHIDNERQRGILTPIEQTEPYQSMPGEPGTSPSRAIVLGINVLGING
jgi:ubiquinone/menaquinone biosynthesis C-methylase UbiE